jgi:hypothetical protein
MPLPLVRAIGQAPFAVVGLRMSINLICSAQGARPRTQNVNWVPESGVRRL